MLNAPYKDSPVEEARKAGPCGDGCWPGFAAVYQKISAGTSASQKITYRRWRISAVGTKSE